MLVPTAERIEDALERLSPEDRALLELSLRRGVSDDEIAALLHVHREHVEHRRELALDQIAGELDNHSRAEVAALVGQSWRVNGQAHADVPPSPSPTHRRRAADLPPSSEARRRVRRRNSVLALGLVAAAVLALVVWLSSGSDSEPTLAPEPAATPAPAKAPAPSGGPTVPLTAANGGPGSGTLQLRGSRLSVRVSGLPSASYAVWLFDDVSNARMVGKFRGSGARLDASLPEGFRSYRFIDVSREPADGNPNHSGASVLRAPVAKLTR
jgi:Anti-sigma-K factor rskA